MWVLQKPSLAAFNLEVLDTNGTPTDIVCNGQSYQVRFSLTVPPNRPPVGDITPQLDIDGDPAPSTAQPPNYPVNPPLVAGQTLTYTYPSLTAPGAPFFGEVLLSAGAVTPQTQDVLFKEMKLIVSDCPAGNAAPVLSWTPSHAKQLSGWTAVPDDQMFVLTLRADDDTRVVSMHYEISGANDTGLPYPEIDNPASSTWQEVEVPLGDPGDTTVTFKARDNNFVWSATQDVNLRLVRVSMKISNEGDVVAPFSFGAPFPGSGVTYSATGLAALGWSINSLTGVMSGPPLSHSVAGDHIITVTESKGALTSSASFTWRITNDNRAPVANDDTYSTNEDTPLTVNAASGLLANDTDADDDELTGIETSYPLGVLVLQPDGSFQYTPPPNFNGTDTFSYRINDGMEYDDATVTITVRSVNDVPSFTGGASQTVTEDAGPQVVTGWATAISSGPSEESAQTVSFLVTNSNNALFSVQPAIAPNGTLTYTPAPNAFGSAVVTVQVKDSGGTANGGDDTSDPQTFSITVTPVADAPIAANDSYILNEDTMLSVPAPGVLANDTGDGPLTAILVTGPSTGTLNLNPNGSFTYMPAANASGSVSFTYKASDGTAQSAAATVTLTVRAVNDAPVLVNPGPQSGAEGATVNLAISASDPDGPALIFSASNLPPGLAINSATGVISGVLSFVSAGTHNVTVTASDGLLSDSETFTWTVSNTTPPAAGCVIVDFREITYFKGERVITSSDAGIRARNGITGLFNPALWPYSPTASATSTTATKSRGTLFRLYGFKHRRTGEPGSQRG